MALISKLLNSLCIASFMLFPLGAHAAAADFKTMDEAMTAGAARAVELAAAAGIKLDYSPESVEVVERQLGGLHDTLQKSVQNPVGMAPPSDREIVVMSFTFGAYIAEVLKRKYGGTWSNQSALYPGREIPTFHVGANRMEMWPQIKVQKRLQNGAEDNVWHYFQVSVKTLESK
ncbi:MULTISPECIES: hypothetical protein [unclassified Variovorax]|uniref:hypothetical protein n=1 Tax=unclassified Variovorax TaxID=663243 RepID=UPI003F487760